MILKRPWATDRWHPAASYPRRPLGNRSSGRNTTFECFAALARSDTTISAVTRSILIQGIDTISGESGTGSRFRCSALEAVRLERMELP